jgi:hypothetical protein
MNELIIEIIKVLILTFADIHIYGVKYNYLLTVQLLAQHPQHLENPEKN